ncbi:purine-binding chemotaxis protein CheW [Methylomagnum ishizawai]|uniref:Chemotaxis protein CheW n=1 Tax=Methylomagnum ishizawai TaxID=1760988 RepID=A0A1Y6D2A1_9GAMM|nr:chemotaxis protein CheW [Methylomagnum ishizawai]SMF94115.1 purine-binding chemotaxis protein CheW [Methylomagnum ishizawai]
MNTLVASAGAETGVPSQYLSFELAGEPYAVDILKVREIKGWEPARELPEAPLYIKGVINLRGTILPIMDLRERFGMARGEYTATTVIVILGLESPAGGEQALGIVVDAVSDVLDVRPDAVRPPPALGAAVQMRYLKGILPGERMTMLLNADALLSERDWDGIEVQLA